MTAGIIMWARFCWPFPVDGQRDIQTRTRSAGLSFCAMPCLHMRSHFWHAATLLALTSPVKGQVGSSTGLACLRAFCRSVALLSVFGGTTFQFSPSFQLTAAQVCLRV